MVSGVSGLGAESPNPPGRDKVGPVAVARLDRVPPTGGVLEPHPPLGEVGTVLGVPGAVLGVDEPEALAGCQAEGLGIVGELGHGARVGRGSDGMAVPSGELLVADGARFLERRPAWRAGERGVEPLHLCPPAGEDPGLESRCGGKRLVIGVVGVHPQGKAWIRMSKTIGNGTGMVPLTEQLCGRVVPEVVEPIRPRVARTVSHRVAESPECEGHRSRQQRFVAVQLRRKDVRGVGKWDLSQFGVGGHPLETAGEHPHRLLAQDEPAYLMRLWVLLTPTSRCLPDGAAHGHGVILPVDVPPLKATQFASTHSRERRNGDDGRPLRRLRAGRQFDECSHVLGRRDGQRLLWNRRGDASRATLEGTAFHFRAWVRAAEMIRW